MAGPGDLLSLTIEKPAAGGRMLARHDGQVILVAGAIPGERVRARVEQRRGGVLFARVELVEEPSPDRRAGGADPACGGSDYAHIEYARQLLLKQAIVADAFARIARHPIEPPVAVHASAERGYRMRARLHARGTRLGFYREGTHMLCDPAGTGQLLDDTCLVIDRLSESMRADAVEGAMALELAENVSGDERAVVLELDPDGRARGPWEALLRVAGLTGAAVSRGGRVLASGGELTIHDTVQAPDGSRVRLGRGPRTFFQGNRHLLGTLVDRVLARVGDGPLVDLYAGCGLFGLCHAAAGRGPVEAVEADAEGAGDLERNAAGIDAVTVHAQPVEHYLDRHPKLDHATVLVDPPRTGLSREAAVRLAGSGAPRIVYLSCDVATLARDARHLLDAGFALGPVELLDLFPATSHVETLLVATRP